MRRAVALANRRWGPTATIVEATCSPTPYRRSGRCTCFAHGPRCKGGKVYYRLSVETRLSRQHLSDGRTPLACVRAAIQNEERWKERVRHAR